MPTRNCRLIEPPFPSGVPRVTVPAESEPLKAVPFGDDGGCSRVKPWAVVVQGGVAGLPVARHVPASPIPATTTATDVRARKSAKPDGAGNVVWSIIRKRNLVTLPPVLFTIRRRNDRVPNVELFGGSLVKSRTRFGGLALETVESNNSTEKLALR